MATATSNLGLTKPAGTEQYNVNVFNDNADRLDSEFGAAGGHRHTGVDGDGTQIPTDGLADRAVTLAKLAGGAAGNLLTYDADGDPSAVAAGAGGQVLTSNGPGAAPTFQEAASTGGAVKVLGRDYSTVTVTGATETSLYSLSVPGNELGTNKMILVHIAGTAVQDHGTYGYALRLKYGATTLAVADPQVSGSPNTADWYIVCALAADNSVSAQKGFFNGNYHYFGDRGFAFTGYGSASEDSTQAKTLDITFQFGAALSDTNCSKQIAFAYLVG